MKDHELLPMSQVLSYILDSAEPLVKVRNATKFVWREKNQSLLALEFVNHVTALFDPVL